MKKKKTVESMQRRKFTPEERKEMLDFCTKNENNYAKTVEHFKETYGVTYSQIYSWTRHQNENSSNTLKENALIPIFLYKILKEQSSEKCPLSRSEIDAKLKDYNINIGKEDRKKTLRYINAFNTYFKDSVVQTTKLKQSSMGAEMKVPAWYFVPEHGPSLSGSNFSLGEATLLIDMIKESKILSSIGTDALVDKIAETIDINTRNELVIKKDENDVYKNENDHLHEIRKKVTDAIQSFCQIIISYQPDSEEVDYEVTPIKIDIINGEYCLIAHTGKELKYFLLRAINNAEVSPLEGDVPDKCLVEDKIANEARKQDIDLEAFFFYRKEINRAIKNNTYVSLVSFVHGMLGKKVELTETPERKVIPVQTTYKNGKPYLIALDPENDCSPTAFRIDLIKNIRVGEKVEWKDRRLCQDKESHRHTDAHPFMMLGFKEMAVKFSIKEDCLYRVNDTFGKKVKYYDKKKVYETYGENLEKLARRYRELNFGYDDNYENLVMFSVTTTGEEAFRFALQNADSVELLEPLDLREKVLEVSEKVQKRYTNSHDDIVLKDYRKAVSGDAYLELGSSSTTAKDVCKLIEKKGACGNVKKLKVNCTTAPVLLDELTKYTGVENLIVEGENLFVFDWIARLPALKTLTLMNTSLKDGSVLAKIPHLEKLYLFRNKALKDYGFLESMPVDELYIGRNGKADLSALYELKRVRTLVLQEALLANVNVKLLESHKVVDEKKRRVRVERWIDALGEEKFPRAYPLSQQYWEE